MNQTDPLSWEMQKYSNANDLKLSIYKTHTGCFMVLDLLTSRSLFQKYHKLSSTIVALFMYSYNII